MFLLQRSFIFTLLLIVSCYAKTTTLYDFENVKIATIPNGWHISATHPKKPLAIWKVIKAKDAPSGQKILALTHPNTSWFSSGTFNLCYTKKIDFKDGEISVKFKANSGNTDQGGGIMWRVQNNNNYYVARFNPLEDNFCFYIVKNSHRYELASADIKLSKGWHKMSIVQHGSNLKGYLDGKKLINCNDMQLNKSGGVGLWTKSDAATSFDDFTVTRKP